MKFFQILYKNLAAIGFTPNQQQNDRLQLNLRQIFTIFKYFTDVIVVGVYVFSKAERSEEYIVPIFSLTVIAGITVSFLSIILKNEKLFRLIKIAADETTFSKCFFTLFLTFY